jgi:hypothetical protein
MNLLPAFSAAQGASSLRVSLPSVVDSHAKGTSETTQTHSHSRNVVTAARPLAELYTHGVTAKNRLRSRVIPMDHPQTKGHEPMRPDPAEAVQPPLSGSSVDRIMYSMHSPHAMLCVRIGGSP